MARDALARFLSEYLPRNPEVKTALDALAGEALVEAAVRAGVAADCAFSDDELRDVMRAAAARRSGGELSEQQLEAVAGGRKAGGSQQEYLIVKLNDVLITGVATDPK
jgi:hypothetical protein